MTSSFDPTTLSIIVNALPDPALVIGESRTVVAANKDASAFFDDDVVGRHLTALFRAPLILQSVDEALVLAKTAQVPHLVRTPVPRSFDVHISSLGVGLALVILRDLTYEEQIERMRSDFVANA